MLALLSGPVLQDPAGPEDPLPVVAGTREIPWLLGRDPGRLAAFRYDGGWHEIPVQVDERREDSLARLRGSTGRGADVPVPVYADPGTAAGADPDPRFDTDDEIVFMAAGAGGEPVGVPPPGPGAWTLLRIEREGARPRWVCLLEREGPPPHAPPRTSVEYRARLLGGAGLAGKGPNPEDTVVVTPAYRMHFSERWVCDGLELPQPDGRWIGVLDRDEVQFAPGVSSRSTDTFSQGGGAIIAQRSGPVRAIRSTIGCNSGALTTRDLCFYERCVVSRTDLRVHPIRSIWLFLNLREDAKGMTYRDDLNPGGLPVDGRPDVVRTGPLRCQQFSGPQGTITLHWRFETDLADVRFGSHYFDDEERRDVVMTGSRRPIGAAGPSTGPLPDTDGGSTHRFAMERTMLLGRIDPGDPVRAAAPWTVRTASPR